MTEKDPVCGMLVEPDQAAGQRTYQGETYYFCSAACLGRFEQTPERYAPAKSPEAEKPRD